MTRQLQAVSDFQKATQHYIAGLPPDRGGWLTDHRWSAAMRFSDLGFPDKRQEAWRYTSIEGLLKQGFVTSDSDVEVAGTEFEHHFLSGPTAGRVVFVDGAFQPSLSDPHIPGVRISNLRSAMETSDLETLKSVGTLSGPGNHGFSALNMATMRDGALIRVIAGSRLDAPIDLISISTSSASGRAMRPRHLIVLERDAEATLVERYLSPHDGAYFNNLVCEVLLEEGASLVHQRVQQESPSAYHLADLHVGLQAEARYRGVNLAMGGAWSRTMIRNRFAAPGASCELHGLYLAGEGQLVDFHLDVDHGVPGCDSRENFRGILYGNGRAVFDGRILVQKQAQKSSAHLSNANLMLSRRAEVDTKPQLEILADDVMCSHGTTVGQIDPQALFYLRSRGLSEERALRLLCLGFASEILEQFQSGDLRDHLAGLIQQKIGSETKEALVNNGYTILNADNPMLPERSDIVEAIRKIYDPEIPVNIYDLGLIYSLDVDQAGVVEVDMTLTAPACPVAGTLPGEVGRMIETVPGVSEAVVRLVWDPPWGQERMTDEARLELGLL